MEAPAPTDGASDKRCVSSAVAPRIPLSVANTIQIDMPRRDTRYQPSPVTIAPAIIRATVTGSLPQGHAATRPGSPLAGLRTVLRARLKEGTSPSPRAPQ